MQGVGFANRPHQGYGSVIGLRRVMALAMIGVLGACSTLSPQIFSDGLSITRGANGAPVILSGDVPKDLAAVYKDAELVRARYMDAVTEQSNAGPRISAGLIALSALTLFKATTGASTGDTAGAAAVTGATLAYNSLLLPKTRLGVYRAGADALSCAMAAAEPYRKGQTLLGKPGDYCEAQKPGDSPKPCDTTQSLYARRTALYAPLAELRSLLLRHQALNANVTIKIPKEPGFRPKEPRPICSAPAAALPEQKAALEKICKASQAAWDKRVVVPKDAVQETLSRAPQARDAFAEAKAEITAADHALLRVGRVIHALEDAGPALWQKSVEIQIQVSAEVDKTIPDPNNVLATVKAFTGASHAVNGADPFKAGAAEGAGDKQHELSADEIKAISNIQSKAELLRQARTGLEGLMVDAIGVGNAQARKAMNACTVKLTGVVLKVTPAGDHLSVAVGASIIFFVSGGSGVPTGLIESGGKPGALALTLEGGQFRFEYKASDVKAGDTVTLHFADGARQAEHLVEISITEPAKPEPVGAKVESPGKSLNDLSRDELDLMGLTSRSTPTEFKAAIERCQTSAVPAIGKTGVYDDDTAKAVAGVGGKTCKAKP